MVDLAYGEFADCDLTEAALELPNALVFRTFSKRVGLAGLRVGYAMGSERWIDSFGRGTALSSLQPGTDLAEASLDEATAIVEGGHRADQ